MKKILLGIMLLSVTIAFAQEKTEEYATNVANINSTIETLYSVISGEKGEARNWQLFTYLFKPDAKLIPSGKNKDGIFDVRYMSPQDYIDGPGNWLVANGFFEKEIYRVENTFGNITQIFSTYESFKTKTDTKPFMRGINSIQLLNDGDRWWIINIYWTSETEENPIQSEYLHN